MWHVGAVRVVVASVLLAMAGCSSDEPEFPAGAWALANPESVVVVEFRPDGTLAGGEGAPGQDPATVPVEPLQFQAQWSATPEQLTLTGPWCGAEVQTAVYRWTLEGDTLSLAVVDDACAEQRKTLDGAALTRVSSPATPSAAPSGSPVAAPVPWWNDEVFYEVFVRSFSDSDGNGDRRPARTDRQAGLPRRPRGDRPVADADRAVAELPRLRHHRLLHG